VRNKYENKVFHLDGFDVNEFSRNFMDHLKEDEKRHFMEVCYIKVMKYPDVIIKDMSPRRVKKNSINVLIKYFEASEEYEKCASLKKFLEEL
jgi:hypothetical protein